MEFLKEEDRTPKLNSAINNIVNSRISRAEGDPGVAIPVIQGEVQRTTESLDYSKKRTVGVYLGYDVNPVHSVLGVGSPFGVRIVLPSEFGNIPEMTNMTRGTIDNVLGKSNGLFGNIHGISPVGILFLIDKGLQVKSSYQLGNFGTDRKSVV